MKIPAKENENLLPPFAIFRLPIALHRARPSRGGRRFFICSLHRFG
jgi:hypothetical protein